MVPGVVRAREAEVGHCELKTSHNVQPQTARKDSAWRSLSCLFICLSYFHLRFPGNVELSSDWHLKDLGSGGKCGRVPGSSLGQLLTVRLVNKAGRHLLSVLKVA